MRKTRSTFRRRTPPPRTMRYATEIAHRSFYQNVRHYQFLHSEKRERSAGELETMRLAAQRRPHGFASHFLAGMGPLRTGKPEATKRARTKKADDKADLALKCLGRLTAKLVAAGHLTLAGAVSAMEITDTVELV